MKKMLFSAIAMVAFSLNSSAQTSSNSLDPVLTLSEILECSGKATDYARSKGPITRGAYDIYYKAFYDGCLEGKKSNKNQTTTNTTISRN